MNRIGSSVRSLVVAAALVAVGATTAVAADSYEPNDTPGQASEVQLGSQLDSYISRVFDRDHFKVWVSSSGTFIVDLDVPANKDYELEVYDSSGRRLARSTRGKGLSEHVSVPVPRGWYVVKVYGFLRYFDAENSYHLQTDFQTQWLP